MDSRFSKNVAFFFLGNFQIRWYHVQNHEININCIVCAISFVHAYSLSTFILFGQLKCCVFFFPPFKTMVYRSQLEQSMKRRKTNGNRFIPKSSFIYLFDGHKGERTVFQRVRKSTIPQLHDVIPFNNFSTIILGLSFESRRNTVCGHFPDHSFGWSQTTKNNNKPKWNCMFLRCLLLHLDCVCVFFLLQW